AWFLAAARQFLVGKMGFGPCDEQFTIQGFRHKAADRLTGLVTEFHLFGKTVELRTQRRIENNSAHSIVARVWTRNRRSAPQFHSLSRRVLVQENLALDARANPA